MQGTLSQNLATWTLDSPTATQVLWFNIVSLYFKINFIFLCFHLIIIHQRTQKQRKIKSKNENTIIIEPQHMHILISVLRCGHLYYNKMLWEHI